MSMHAIAHRYAGALLDVVKRNDTMDAAHAGLSSFAALVAGSPELANVFSSPGVPLPRKSALAAELAQRLNVTPEIARLLAALGDRDRLMYVTEVAAAFEARVNLEHHVQQASVTTAVPLTDANVTALAEALGRATGGTVKIETHVDPSIVGGVVARVGSMVFDGSVTRQLERMKTQLANTQNS